MKLPGDTRMSLTWMKRKLDDSRRCFFLVVHTVDESDKDITAVYTGTVNDP